MHRILVLWATPRSTSTAFEWMMRMRGDFTCFHEPFGEAWYLGEEARAPRVTADTPRKSGLKFVVVIARLERAAGERPVFLKDMPQFTEHLWNDEFLDRFEHSFLIRDPAKVLASLERSYARSGHPGFTRNEVGFAEQRRLFDILCERRDKAPIVIDSDDLLENPVAMVERYCEAVGIPFIAGALSWGAGGRDEVLWYDADGSVWHESLRKSTGLEPRPRRHVDPATLSAERRADYEAFAPHYRHLYEFRLRPAGHEETANA